MCDTAIANVAGRRLVVLTGTTFRLAAPTA
jgi:hypothetical protein